MSAPREEWTLLWNDVRFAARTLAKSPGFTAVVLLTLALGIGANTAIFGLLDQVMLRPLAVADPGRLVVVDAPGVFSGRSSSQTESLTPLSHPMFRALQAQNRAFSGMLAHWTFDAHLAAGEETREGGGDLVSGSFFPVLGVKPALGRLLGPEDDLTPGGPPVAVLGHRAFAERFGADPGVVGRTVRVNGQPLTVVGVVPASFHGLDVGASVDVYVPLSMQAQVLPTMPALLDDWRSRWLTVEARLAPGVSAEQAAASLNVLYAQLLREDAQHLTAASDRLPPDFFTKRLDLLPGGRGASSLRDRARSPLLVLMAMVGLVLLIACANVANLLLARGSARRKELAVRLALGAGRGRLVRQLLAESLMLSLSGGALGLALSVWLGHVLVAALPFDDAIALRADPDLRVGLFAFGLAALTGVVFGLLPALQSTRVAVSTTLRNEAGSVIGGAAPFRFRKGLVVAQIALSLLLLVGAGLFTRSLQNLRGLDPGFRPDQLVTFTVNPALDGYDMERRRQFFDRLREALAAEPSVQAVSLVDLPLMSNAERDSTIGVQGYAPAEDEDMNVNSIVVGPRFFTTLGVPVVRGREVDERDARGGPKVAVVNESFARYFFRGADPIGRRFGPWRTGGKDYEIVGVVKDGKNASLRETTRRFFYVPHTQTERLGAMTFYVRAASDPDALVARIGAVLRALDPTLPVSDLKTMRAQIQESLFVERMVAALSAAFGALATLLAALGLYGVMAFAVSLRTREIGIRMALGAQGSDVLAMVLRDVCILVAAGVALGLPSGYSLARVVESQLFGLHARDPLTFAAATFALLLAALLAGYLPARRATRVDPMVALRS